MNRPTDLRKNGGGVRPPRGPGEMAVDESTGLPGVRSWRTVYAVVLGLFVLWVGLLTWLTVVYS